MNKSTELINLIEDESWEDVIISGNDTGVKVSVTKPEHSPSIRRIYKGDKYYSTYDLRQSSENSAYKKKFKLAK